MIKRNLEPIIKQLAREYPVLSIVGPRQSGKTTLARALFPGYTYLSLENLDLRLQAENDPRGFLNDYGEYLILDEIQRAPGIFSYLQERVDFNQKPAQYILTGSQQFLLMEKISQSLAGRIITFKLFPLSLTELYQWHRDTSIENIFELKRPAPAGKSPFDVTPLILSGFYPRIHDKKLSARKWIENYILTYVEKDIRNLVNVSDLRLFENFLKLCAAYSGQLVNYAAISNAVGISQPTIKRWISLLETSGIIFILPPHYKNFTKRIVKTPKLYFVDTGILCFLLSIKTSSELKAHPLYGHIFETFILSEFYKCIAHIGEIPPLYFWRDKTGNEIDLLVDFGTCLLPVEIKSSQTFSSFFKDPIKRWMQLKGNNCKKGMVVYAGNQVIGQSAGITALPWWYL